jgi:hypothetical protein
MRRACAIILACLLLSGHAAGLQVLAWTGMFADNLARMTVTEALDATFNPKPTCRICRAVAVIRADVSQVDAGVQKAPSSIKATPKPDLSVAMDLILPSPVSAHTRYQRSANWRLPPDMGVEPPVPPPQG